MLSYYLNQDTDSNYEKVALVPRVQALLEQGTPGLPRMWHLLEKKKKKEAHAMVG